MKQKTIQPVINYTEYITEHAQDFTGRKWVFEQINAWLADTAQSRFFLLLAEPGSGKTALAARLYQFSLGLTVPPGDILHLSPGFLSACHFCSARDSLWIDPLTFARSLALQLARYPHYAEALLTMGENDFNIQVQLHVQEVQAGGVVQAVVIENLIVANLSAQECFNRIVAEPLRTLYSNGFSAPITILVDGLDEALVHPGRPTIVELLSRLQTLPSQVRFILTSRSDTRIEEAFPEAESFLLLAPLHHQHNRKDVGDYISMRLAPDNEFAEKIMHLTPEQVNAKIEILTDKAAANFQYITFLLKAIARKLRTFDELDGLPEGLDNLYADSLRRVLQQKSKEWSTDYAPVLGVLSVAQQSLTFEQLQALTGQTERAVSDCVNDLQQFIESVQSAKRQGEDGEEAEVFSLYHQSFIDFLQQRQLILPNKKKVRNTYYLPAEEWHKQIVRVCESGGLAAIWQDAKLQPVEEARCEYARQHYITHLYQAQEWDRLYAVLDAGDYGRGKVRTYSGMLAYARDLESGQQAVTREGMNYEARVALLPALWRYSLLRRSLSTQIDNYPDIAFNVMVVLGQQQEALELVGLLTDPRRQVKLLLDIGVQVVGEGRKEDAWQVFLRASSVIRGGIGSDPAIISSVVQMLAEVQLFEHRVPFLDELAEIAQLIRDDRQRMTALVAVAVALATEQEWKRAEAVAEAIPYSSQDSQTLRETVETLVKAQLWDSATSIALSISDEKQRNKAREAIVLGLSEAQEWDKAKALAQTAGKNNRFYAFAAVARARAQAQPELAEEVLAELAGLAYAEDNTDYGDTIFGSSDRDVALKVVAKYLAKARLWQRALTIASSISNSATQYGALSVVIEELVKAQLWERAIAVAWSMHDGRYEEFHSRYGQVEAMHGIVKALMESGHRERARELLTEMVQKVCHQEQQDHVLSEAVKALITGQLWDSADTLAHAIRDSGEKFNALIDLASALSTAQPERSRLLLAEAETIANNDFQRDNGIEDDRQTLHARKLVNVVKVLAKMQLWDQAITMAHTIYPKGLWTRDEAFVAIVDSLVGAHKWDMAVSIAEAIVEEYHRRKILVATVKAMVEAQEWDTALKTVQSISRESYKAEALAIVIEALMVAQTTENISNMAQFLKRKGFLTDILIEARDESGLPELDMDEEGEKEELVWPVDMTPSPKMAHLWDSIKLTAQSLSRGQARSETLATLFITMANVNLWDNAIDAVRMFTSKEDRADALHILVQAMITAGAWGRAIEITRSMSESKQKAEALADLAAVLTKVVPEQARQLLSEALTAARFIADNEKLKTKALTMLSDELSEARQWGRVIEIARSIPDASERVKILIGAADAMAPMEPKSAISLLSEAATVARSLDEDEEVESWSANWKRREKIERLSAIAEALAALGQTEQAARIRTEVQAIAKSAENDDERESHDAGDGGVGVEDSTDEKDEGFPGEMQEWEKAFEYYQYSWPIDEPWRKAWELTRIASRLMQAGHLDKAKQLLFEAEASAQSMEKDDKRDSALYEVARVLLEARELENAEVVAASISQENRMKDHVLSKITSVLAEAQQWEKAEDMVRDIKGDEQRVQALDHLVHTFIGHGEHARTLQLIQKYWMSALPRDGLLMYLWLARYFIADEPEMGWAFYEAFDWVDNFLKG